MVDLLETLGDSEVVRVPDVRFDFENDLVFISGESYPESGRRHFEETFADFFEHYTGQTGGRLTVTFALTYYNSGSAHFFATFMTFLDELAAAGNEVEIVWQYYEDDDSMQECGEDFGEELEHVKFTMEELEDDEE